MSDVKSELVAMIVDDSEADQFFHQHTIEKTGLFSKILCFDYATDALVYLNEEANLPVDVIFLDINMPRMNGFEFLEAAESDFGDSFARVVVAMVTSSLDPRDVEKSKEFDIIKEFIDKPLTVDDVNKIAGYLDQG
jgi:CheY-like chemotaxis protein